MCLSNKEKQMRMKRIKILKVKILVTLSGHCRERIKPHVANVCFKLSGLMGVYFIFNFLLECNCFCSVVSFRCTAM